MSHASTSEEPHDLTSAVKVLRILDAVGRLGECSLGDVLRETQLSKSTVLRLLTTLVAEGYLDRPAHGRYRPALKLWKIGCRAVDFENVRSTVIPALQRLAANTGETSLYAVYDNGNSVYVEKVESSHPIRAYTNVGMSSPAYATATGKVLLAWQGELDIRTIFMDAERFTPATATDPDEFLLHANEIRAQGYAINRGEWRDGVWGIAAPVRDAKSETVAAVSVSGPEDRIAPRTEELAALVVTAAAELSARFGEARS